METGFGEGVGEKMVTRKEQIISKVIEILKNNPNGVRYSQLIREVQTQLPDVPVNTIHGTVWNIDVERPSDIYKPARGLYRHTSFRETVITPEQKITGEIRKIREQDFYKPFADYLVNELEECTRAVPLGGNRFKDKWSTPDVIGTNESSKKDILKHETEIVSAEIKTDSEDLITAFGQACSYKLFSHKTYIVIPKNSSEEDKAKLDSLCMIFGIGLILFDSSNPSNPQFEIRVRPSKHEPDMFYANKYIELVHELW